MAEKNVQDYLNQGVYGTPQLKPDEQNKYLGCFRERLYLSATFTESTQKNLTVALAKEFAKHPEAELRLNGGLPGDLLNELMELAMNAKIKFEIINDVQKNADNTQQIALVFVAQNAVDEPVITLSEKYPVETASPNETENKNLPRQKLLDKIFKLK